MIYSIYKSKEKLFVCIQLDYITVQDLIKFSQHLHFLLSWMPSYPNPPLNIWGGIIVPMPPWESSCCCFAVIFQLYFGLHLSDHVYFIHMQERPKILLFIWPVKASYIPRDNIIHLTFPLPRTTDPSLSVMSKAWKGLTSTRFAWLTGCNG